MKEKDYIKLTNLMNSDHPVRLAKEILREREEQKQRNREIDENLPF